MALLKFIFTPLFRLACMIRRYHNFDTSKVLWHSCKLCGKTKYWVMGKGYQF